MKKLINYLKLEVNPVGVTASQIAFNLGVILVFFALLTATILAIITGGDIQPVGGITFSQWAIAAPLAMLLQYPLRGWANHFSKSYFITKYDKWFQLAYLIISFFAIVQK